MATENKGGEKMDTQEMMEVYKKLGTPGPKHKLLAGMEGSWNAKIKSWMEPGKPPMESSGTSENNMILGGRFLQQDFSAEMMGSPFSGLGISGYDNNIKKFVSTWIDSMGTGIFFFEGAIGADPKAIIEESQYNDPIKGPMKWRSITKVADENSYDFVLLTVDKTGTEEKMMEIAYTRKR
jgi:hypothetical protein